MKENELEKIIVNELEVKQLELIGMNVNKFTNKKKNLTYLSWSHAWEEFVKVFPKATYSVKKDIEGNAFFGKSNIGYMVFTTVKVMDIEREMWLLVMDGANNALKDEPYEYTTKYGTKTVDSIDMFDINKTIMRCLVKNLAMFGLGLYIYKGEDLPTDTEKIIEPKVSYVAPKPVPKKVDAITPPKVTKTNVEVNPELVPITQKQIARIHILFNESKANKENLYDFFKIKSSKELNTVDADVLIQMLVVKKSESTGKISQIQIGQILALLKQKGFTKKSLLIKHKLKMLDEMLYLMANEVIEGLKKLEDKK